MPKETTCQICNKEFKRLGFHVKKLHKISPKEYYDTYLKKNNKDKCKTCENITTFIDIERGYRNYCSTKCVANNEKLTKQRTKKFKDTIAKTPEIITERIEKYKNWCRENPQLVKNKSEKGQQTRRDNPEILERQITRRKQTFRENPELQLEATRKSVETRMKDPEKFKEIGNKIAISQRNTYKELMREDSTLAYFLYIISHETKPIIKIGITSSLERRLREINRDFGNSSLTFSIENTFNTLTALENYLHDYFNGHCRVQPKGDGRTEWFDVCVLEEAESLISHYSVL